MDKSTRNLIQKATQDARGLLETEFAEQFSGVFDIRMDGTIDPKPGKHLDEKQKLVREKLVAAVEHEKAAGVSDADAVAAYLREATFTALNRFVALKMLEARGLVQECVTKGEQSSGFKEFCGLAPGLTELSDHGYRHYIESLFDELGTEVQVLFDRRDTASLLWPRQNSLEDLLAVINRDELAGVWGEDEIIGWVYQYFNSGEERKKMRDESTAPRNSRELAVRNQFFTPRYVVEFLTDNTLGRTWYEMRQGQTRLKEQCQYLVRRPNEVFLKDGLDPVEEDEREFENFSQEELLNRTHYIHFRAKKDPRDIKTLDPACGSGHFLLYAFDLLMDIYEEGWDDSKAPKSKATGKTLKEDYPEIEDLHLALPGLILRHNLHGIDIDTRAVQIAALSLWVRAQKAYSAFNVDRRNRPAIRKTNLVTAEPMPGEKDMLREFTKTLQPRFLGQLVEAVFDKMQLAGEAGSLLKIEDDIRGAIAQAEKQQKGIPRKQAKLFALDEHPEPLQVPLWDTSGTDEQFWKKAEEKIYKALARYSKKARNGGIFQRKLFAEDTARGFAFIDLCRESYDVALMNPPFGDASLPSKPYIEDAYGDTKGDVYKTFVECFQDRLVPAGMLGIISNRTGFFLTQSSDWRQRVVLRIYRPMLLADLGHGVLDAMVETAAYVLRSLSLLERKELILSIIPELAKIPRDTANCFSIPKYQKSRGGLKRHQAIGELEQMKAEGFLEEVMSGHRKFRPYIKKISRANVPPKKHFPTMICFRAIESQKKENTLRQQINTSFRLNQVFAVRPDSFETIPNAPFAYWVSPNIRRLFNELQPFENGHRTAKLGLTTNNDFRFLRLWWELSPTSLSFFSFAKGGEYSPYYSDLPLALNWGEDGKELKAFAETTPGTTHWSRNIRSPDFYFRPGLTWSRRTTRDISLRLMPKRCMFADKGPAAFSENDNEVELLSLLSLMNSKPFKQLISVQIAAADAAARSYDVGLIQRTPVPKIDIKSESLLAKYAIDACRLKRFHDTSNEVSHAFTLPELLQVEGKSLKDLSTIWINTISSYSKHLLSIQQDIDMICFDLYGIPVKNLTSTNSEIKNEKQSEIEDKSDIKIGAAGLTASLFSWTVGVVMGRFDLRLVLDKSLITNAPSSLFDSFQTCSPGMLIGQDGLSYQKQTIVSKNCLSAQPHTIAQPPEASVRNLTSLISEYPISIAWDGIMVDDPGYDGGQLHDKDVVLRIREVLEMLWTEKAPDIEQESCEILNIPDLRTWFRKKFFTDHIKRYSKSRRKAPIYWQLSTTSTFYSIWLYYQRLTIDTLYKVLNEYVSPKLQFEERELNNLRQQYGPDPTARQRKELGGREIFVEELRTFKEEVARIAPLWNPNLNDGVIINFAPLWRLVPQNKPWQKQCKACWDKLVKGDYDWAHLAMHLWPERVVPKCAKDRSLSIAHCLEKAFWEEDEDGKWKPKKVSKETKEALIQERTSPTVKAALENLLKAPVPSGATRKRRK